MKSFKQFVTEVLTQAQKDIVDKKWKKGNHSFSDKAFNDPADQRVSIPLEQPDTPSDHRKAVEDHLGKNGYTIKDYIAGKATDKYGREVNIGRALGNTKASKDLIDRFTNDPARQQKKTSAAGSDVHVVISRHPHDVAGMTSGGHSWEQESCMNFETGGNKKYLPKEVLHGTHTAWLVKKDDTDLTKPYSRIALKPYDNVDVPGDRILRPEDNVYGDAPGSFAHTVNKWAEENFPAEPDGIYKKHKDVYDDSGQKYYMHKSAINKALEHPDVEVRRAGASHPEINEDQINRGLDKDQNYKVRIAAASNRNATEANLHKALDHKVEKDLRVREAAAGNRSATEGHLDKALTDPSIAVRAAAAENANATKKHLDKAFTDDELVRRAAARNHNISKDRLDKIFGMGDHSPEDADTWSVKAAAASNRNATSEHLDKALSDRVSAVKIEAIKNANATPTHIHRALDEDDEYMRTIAASHTNASNENLHKALQAYDSRGREVNNMYVRSAAAGNKNATKEHLRIALNDNSEMVRKAAKDNPNYKKYFG